MWTSPTSYQAECYYLQPTCKYFNTWSENEWHSLKKRSQTLFKETWGLYRVFRKKVPCVNWKWDLCYFFNLLQLKTIVKGSRGVHKKELYFWHFQGKFLNISSFHSIILHLRRFPHMLWSREIHFNLSIQHKLSSDYSLNIRFSCHFPCIDGPSFSP